MAKRAEPEIGFDENGGYLKTILLMLHIEEREDLDGVVKKVLQSIGYRRHRNTLLCCPSIKDIVKRSGFKRTAVIEAIEVGKQKNEILVRRGPSTNKGRGVNHYVFLFDAQCAIQNMRDGNLDHVEEFTRKMLDDYDEWLEKKARVATC